METKSQSKCSLNRRLKGTKSFEQRSLSCAFKDSVFVNCVR